MDESKLPKFVSIKTSLLKELLYSTPLTGESMRVAIAYFVAGGNMKIMEDLTHLPSQIIKDVLFYLNSRKYLNVKY